MHFNLLKIFIRCPVGTVVIASAYKTKDTGFESHQGERLFGLFTLLLSQLYCIVIVCT
jgi:hypothetical protein